MRKSEKLLQQIRKVNRQGLPVTNFPHVIGQYRPLGRYMLKKFGWRSWYSFWTTKLFIADEGGEYAIKDYFLYRFFQSARVSSLVLSVMIPNRCLTTLST